MTEDTESTKELPLLFPLHQDFCPITIGQRYLERDVYTKEALSVYALPDQIEVDKVYYSALETCCKSETYQRLKSILWKCKQPQRIIKVIGFACGPIYDHNPITFETGFSPRSAGQHALLSTLKADLDQKQGRDGIVCYAQDILYTERDSRILQRSNITVLENPNALLEIDDANVVFACCPTFPIKQITRYFARPSILIWNRVYKGRHALGASVISRQAELRKTLMFCSQLTWTHHKWSK